MRFIYDPEDREQVDVRGFEIVHVIIPYIDAYCEHDSSLQENLTFACYRREEGHTEYRIQTRISIGDKPFPAFLGALKFKRFTVLNKNKEVISRISFWKIHEDRQNTRTSEVSV